jgi:hypothetical protein
MLGRGRGIGDNGGHGRVWASVWYRWEGQIDCRSEGWQGLVGSPLHQVSRDVGSPGGLEGGATLSRGSVRASNYAVGAEAEKNLEMRQEAGQRGVGEGSSTRRVFLGGAGVEGIKMARTDSCVWHRAGREWLYLAGKGALESGQGSVLDTAAGMQ